MRKDGTEEYHLFVYDTQYGIWHREDAVKVDFFCFCNNELYLAMDGEIRTVSGSPSDEKVRWMAETGVIGIESPDKKRLSRLSVRLSAGPDTEVRIFADYDSAGDWKCVYTRSSTSLKSVAVPIRTRRHDHLRLRIEGEGDAKIYSITKTIDQGSDI